MAQSDPSSSSSSNPVSSDTAALQWQDDGLPRSTQFGDIYFSADDAQGETRHVFLQGNDLARRWKALAGGRFTLAECGFGSGLNFLSSWQLWQQCAPAGSTLHYIACEKYPLAMDDLIRMHARWATLSHYSEILQSRYPAATRGVHRLYLDTGPAPVILDLLYGEAEAMLHDLYLRTGRCANAWFLDGFAPARNPAMWSGSLMQQVAALSRPGASLSTYSVARDVRQGLSEAGFQVEKAPGFGRKRHMLRASLTHAAGPAIRSAAWDDRGHQPVAPWFKLPVSPARPEQVAIIGAGLAGCSTAWALARRGVPVTLIEREEKPAQGASGNPQGIVYCKMSRAFTPAAQFYLQAYLYALRHYTALQGQQGFDFAWRQCGLLQLAWSARERDRLSSILNKGCYPQGLAQAVTAARAAQLAGLPLEHQAVYFPLSAWLDPARLCENYAAAPGITRMSCSQALELQQRDGRWQIYGNTREADPLPAEGSPSQAESRVPSTLIAEADVVVVAANQDTALLPPCRHYPLIPVRGQLTRTTASAHSARLSCILCTNGYLIPADQGWHSLGGSFRADSTDTGVLAADHERNLGFVQDMSAQLYREFSEQEELRGRASLRSSTPDRLPLTGPVEDYAGTLARFGALSRDASTGFSTTACYESGLFVNAGHGSHGITTTPLLADYLACLICGDILPLQTSVIHALHPSRFLIRQLKKQQL